MLFIFQREFLCKTSRYSLWGDFRLAGGVGIKHSVQIWDRMDLLACLSLGGLGIEQPWCRDHPSTWKSGATVTRPTSPSGASCLSYVEDSRISPWAVSTVHIQQFEGRKLTFPTHSAWAFPSFLTQLLIGIWSLDLLGSFSEQSHWWPLDSFYLGCGGLDLSNTGLAKLAESLQGHCLPLPLVKEGDLKVKGLVALTGGTDTNWGRTSAPKAAGGAGAELRTPVLLPSLYSQKSCTNQHTKHWEMTQKGKTESRFGFKKNDQERLKAMQPVEIRAEKFQHLDHRFCRRQQGWGRVYVQILGGRAGPHMWL